jgi:DNA integrity scanning protein DisA with diadenylate cyclase activity
MFTFNKKYFLLTILLFLIEVLIALYVHDRFVRPYIGDVLVVILLYCFVKTFISGRTLPVAIGVLVFSYFIEMMQYFKLVNLLGLQHSKLANIVIGNSFSWADILAYTAGIAIVLLAERSTKNRMVAK